MSDQFDTEILVDLPGFRFEDHITPNGTFPVSESATQIVNRLLRPAQLKLLDTDEKKELVATLLTSNHPEKQLKAVFELYHLDIRKLTFYELDKNVRYLTFNVTLNDESKYMHIKVASTDHKGYNLDCLQAIRQPDGQFTKVENEGYYPLLWMEKVGAKSYLSGGQYVPQSLSDSYYNRRLPFDLAEVFLQEETFAQTELQTEETQEIIENESDNRNIVLKNFAWNSGDNLDLALENMSAEERAAYSEGKYYAQQSKDTILQLDDERRQKYEFYKTVYADLFTASFLGTETGEKFLLKQEFNIIHGKNSLPHKLVESIDSVDENSAMMKAIEFVYSMSNEDSRSACSETLGKELRDSIQRVLFTLLNDIDAEVILDIYDKKIGLIDLDEWSTDSAQTVEPLTFSNKKEQTQTSDWKGVFENGQDMLVAIANLNANAQRRFKSNEDGFRYEIFKQVRNSRIMTREQKDAAVRILNRLILPPLEGELRTDLQDDLIILNGQKYSRENYIVALSKGLKDSNTLSELKRNKEYSSLIRCLLESGMGTEDFDRYAKPLLDDLNPDQ